MDQPWSSDPRKVALVLVAFFLVLLAVIGAARVAARLGIEADHPIARIAVVALCAVLAGQAVAAYVRARGSGAGGHGGGVE